MASKHFVDNRKAYDAIVEEVNKLDNSYVLVGFQSGEVTRAAEKTVMVPSGVKIGKKSFDYKARHKKEAGLSIAQIASENEFGTSLIPPRPFMRTSFDENRTKIDKAVKGEYNKIVKGQSTVKRSLDLIGLFMTDLIYQKIRAIHYPPNSPTTIAIKGSSKPLIDFGQMISAVTWKTVVK